MASVFQKIATALARPFTKHLRELLDKDSREQKKTLQAGFKSQLDGFLKQNTQVRPIDSQDLRTLLIEHSRYTADNLELLATLQTALCEKMDSLTVSLISPSEQREIQFREQIGALAASQISLSEKMDALAVSQTSLSEGIGISLRRFVIALDSERALVRTVVGYMVCARTDPALLGELHDTGELEPGLRRFIEGYLDEGMTFIDVGAHIGMHTIAAARCVGRKGRVYAFEATPTTAEYLRQNVIQNGLESQTEVHSGFIGAASGVTPFHLCAINGQNSKFELPHKTEAIELPVVALDDALKEVPRADLIKIDVEGAELEVFAGMHQLLKRSPGVCVVAEFSPIHIERSGTSSEEWEAFCHEHGLEVALVEEPSGNLRRTSFAELMSLETANVLMARGNGWNRVV